jgi:PBSX family phage terminase large subunit
MTGKTNRALERNIIRPIIQITGNRRARYNQGRGELTLFGHKIDCLGASDERAQEKIRGATLYGSYGDEITLWPESYFTMLLSRLSEPGAKFFGTTNPDGPYHWLKTKYLDRQGELNLKRFPFILDDNVNLDPEYVAQLKKEYTGLWYKRFILGLWVQAEGAIYDMWDDSLHVIDFEKLFTDKPKAKPQRFFAACDYGTANPTVFGLFAHSGRLPAYLMREYHYDSAAKGRQKTDSEYADDFIKWLGDTRISCLYVDPSAASFIAELKKRHVHVIEAKNDVIDGIRFVGALLQNKQFAVDRACKNTIQEIPSYVWDAKAQQKGEDKPITQNDHCADMVRYGLFSHFWHPQISKQYVGMNFN